MLGYYQNIFLNKKIENTHIMLYDTNKIFKCTPAGHNILELSEWEMNCHIGVWPINISSKISTKGLQWDLKHGNTFGFSKYLSCSNSAIKNSIEIDSDVDLIWFFEKKR